MSETKRFRPERTIYLSKEILGVETDKEVQLAIETLRSKYWACTQSKTDDSVKRVESIEEIQAIDFLREQGYIVTREETRPDERIEASFDNKEELEQFLKDLAPFRKKKEPQMEVYVKSTNILDEAMAQEAIDNALGFSESKPQKPTLIKQK